MAALALACVVASSALRSAESNAVALPIGLFSAAPPGMLPDGWRPLIFPRIDAHTRYAVVADAMRGQVVRAEASASASGLVRKIDIDPREWPLLRWQWKADRLVQRADVTTKRGDDYAVRIYVAFAYDPQRVSLLERAWYAAARIVYGEDPPQAGLNYIWDRKTATGTIVPNAYTSRVRMIVVESGEAQLGRWLEYERNIVDDYRRAFGSDPPRIAAIALMSDTDNTGETVTASYGDIVLARAQ